MLAPAFGLPVVVENDANLAALAEGRAGAAVGMSDYVFIAIGTGIGMGIVMEGRQILACYSRSGARRPGCQAPACESNPVGLENAPRCSGRSKLPDRPPRAPRERVRRVRPERRGGEVRR